MMRIAPASRAPCTMLSPTPPQPITNTLDPGRTFAWRTTAPTPVATLQPTSAACAHGISSRMRTRFSSEQATDSPNVPMRAIWLTAVPFMASRVVPSYCTQPGVSAWPMQSTERPVAQ